MTDKPSHVRIATPDDQDALAWHCYELFKDNYMGLPYSPARVAETVSMCCNGSGGIAGVIDGDDGEPIGSIGIIATQTNYSETWILSESWVFVTPEHRKSTSYGHDLFQFANWHREDMARKLGYEIPLEMTVLSFKRLKAKTRWWGRFGRHVGSTFWIGANTSDTPDLRKVN